MKTALEIIPAVILKRYGAGNGERSSQQHLCRAIDHKINAQLIPIGTLSKPRADMVVASAGNKILFAGGYNTGGISTRVDIFDFEANTWSTAELSSQRHGIAAVAAGNKIFFAGGVADGSDFRSTDVDIYDVATNTWSLSHMSTEGDNLTTATTGNKVFFAGGNLGIYPTSTVNIYDLTSNTWSTASLSAPRNFPTAVSANNKVYFTGGDSWTGPISNVIDIYNNTTGAWSTSYLQVPRDCHAAIAVNDILYFAGGGRSTTTPTCSVETLNTNTGARTLMNLSEPREGLYAVVKDNKILFLRNVTWMIPTSLMFMILSQIHGQLVYCLTRLWCFHYFRKQHHLCSRCINQRCSLQQGLEAGILKINFYETYNQTCYLFINNSNPFSLFLQKRILL